MRSLQTLVDSLWSSLSSEAPAWLLRIDHLITWEGFAAIAGLCFTALAFFAERIESSPVEPDLISIKSRKRRLVQLQAKAAWPKFFRAFVLSVIGLFISLSLDPAAQNSTATFGLVTLDVGLQGGCLAGAFYLMMRGLRSQLEFLQPTAEEKEELGRLPKDIKTSQQRLDDLEKRKRSGEKLLPEDEDQRKKLASD